MAKSSIAKLVAIGLGVFGFLSGLLVAVNIYLIGIWSGPAPNDTALFWLITAMLIFVFVPPLVAFIAARSRAALTVYVCLALLIAYVASVYVWMNL